MKTIDPNVSPHAPNFRALPWGAWLPLLLAAITFLVYWPSLKSDFVYDARIVILDEGFVTSPSNLPAVLSFHVLGMNLTLGDRPGQMLYLMLIAAICGKHPFGYHLSSNLLHAANVALLFILLCRLVATEITGLAGSAARKVQWAIAAVVLIFAVHPIAVEAVAQVSYSSDLLVTFFTLGALLAATAFRPENFRVAMIAGGVGTLCAFAAVTCKESGLEVALLLGVYWFLFRRREANLPWFLFVGAATVVTTAFLAARFYFAPPAQEHISYLGGSFFQVLLVQPSLWVFMMGKLLWPTHLSADYTLLDMGAPSTFVALPTLIIVVLLQAWLVYKSRIGALGVAVYWLGLVTVSNFIPLYRPVADRFYYLPLAGVVMQLLALLLMTLKSQRGFWMAVVPCLIALLPLTHLTRVREYVFSNEATLWSVTLQVSPLSVVAHNSIGLLLFQNGKVKEAIDHYLIAMKTSPNEARSHNDLAIALFQTGEVDRAMDEFQKALELNPNYAEVHNNIGNIFFFKREMDDAMDEYKEALKLNPNYAEAHNGLGNILFSRGELDAAMAEFQATLKINPDYAQAHNNLGMILFQKGRMDEAIDEFQKALRINPGYTNAQNNLDRAKATDK